MPTDLASGSEGDCYASSVDAKRVLCYNGINGAFRVVFVWDDSATVAVWMRAAD